MVIQNDLDRMNAVYEVFKDSFISFFHTALWRIYPDNMTAGKVCCFVRVYKNRNLTLGIAYANEPGFQPLPAHFKDGITYNQAQEIVNFMNAEVFNLNEAAAFQIELSSMTAKEEEKQEAETEF